MRIGSVLNQNVHNNTTQKVRKPNILRYMLKPSKSGAKERVIEKTVFKKFSTSLSFLRRTNFCSFEMPKDLIFIETSCRNINIEPDMTFFKTAPDIIQHIKYKQAIDLEPEIRL